MGQVLDLSKVYSQADVDEAARNSKSFEDIEAGGYVCTIVDAILNNDPAHGKQNIELHLDIAEGPFVGYYQKLEDRAGFWGLRGYMSFKKTSLDRFAKICTAINLSNPGYSFDPLKGGTDIDTLRGKKIGVIIQKEEYISSKNNEIRTKDTVYTFTEVEKIRKGKFKVPDIKKLSDDDRERFEDKQAVASGNWMDIPDGAEDTGTPFN